MVVIVDTSNIPGSQPLPRLEDFLVAILRTVVPAPDTAARRFDLAKLKEIKQGFKPKPMDDGGGCMLTAYNVLDTLYGKGFGKTHMNEVIANAYKKADEEIKKNPGAYKNMTRDQVAGKYNTSKETFELLGKKGLAGEKVHTANKDADEAIRQLIPPQPGVYAFGMAVRNHHTVTLIVERRADGTQSMHWLDQHTVYDPKSDTFKTERGAPREVKEGKLGDALENWVFNGPNTTDIYALRPPANAKP
jgi:hypothetical protein